MEPTARAPIPRQYLSVTMAVPIGVLAWMTAHLVGFTAEDGPYRRMMADFGGSLPPITATWLAVAPWTPLLVLVASGVALHVIRRHDHSLRYACTAFGAIFLTPWLLFAWSLIAAYGPIFRIAKAIG